MMIFGDNVNFWSSVSHVSCAVIAVVVVVVVASTAYVHVGAEVFRCTAVRQSFAAAADD